MMPVYARTKFELKGYIEAMAAVYAGLGMFSSLIESGPVETAFFGNVTGSNEAPAELHAAAKAFQASLAGLRPTTAGFQTRSRRPSVPSTFRERRPTSARSCGT